jgi:hypothetical protein
MTGRDRYIPGFIILAVLTSAIAWIYIFGKTPLSVAAKVADIEVEASTLLHEFEADKDAANEIYLRKVLLVSGIVESVSQDDMEITVYLKGSRSNSGVICSFDRSAIDMSRIKRGSRVQIKGICRGFLRDIILIKCSLESGMKYKEDYQTRADNLSNYIAFSGSRAK